MQIRSALTHSAQAVAEASLIALLVVGLMAGSVFAAKGGQGKPGGGATSGGTVAGPVMVRDANSNGIANYMDDITFTVSSTAAKPLVGLRCYQGSSFVLDGYVGYWPDYMFTPYFTLGSGYWDPALAASCTARLFYYDSRGREHVQSTLTFGVAP